MILQHSLKIVLTLSIQSKSVQAGCCSSGMRLFSVSSIPRIVKDSKVRFSQKGRKGLEDNSKSFSALIESAIKRFNGMISQKGGRPLIGVLIRDLSWVGGRLTRSRAALIVTFVRMCHHLHKHEGMKGLVLYLKTSYVLLQQSVAGYIVEDLGPLKMRVRRDRSGIPLWIPVIQRNLIRAKDIRTIRFWTSLVSIYRVLSFPAPVSVSSIINPGVDWVTNVSLGPYREGLEQAILLFWNKVKGSDLKKMLKPLSFFSILKSSPLTSQMWDPDQKMVKEPSRKPESHREIMERRGKLTSIPVISTHPKVINQAAFTIMSDSTLRDDMMLYASDQEGFFEFFSSMTRCCRMADPPLSYVGTPYTEPQKVLPLGKLGLKDEPAGKVRVFAMVDCWTQWLLFPLHKLLQEALRQINEDATFDQVGVVEQKIDSVSLKYKKSKAFSFDLSSATDRLPIGLQVSVLTPLLGEYPSKAWASILTDRKYTLPLRAKNDTGLDSVKYAVGQPMGAYSSWVMLAVVHHVIIQWAAYVVGKVGYKRWFEDYVVLGDDVVIFDPLVGGCYHYIMTELLGVGVGLAKSIKSHNGMVLEFAKKLWVDGKRCFVVPMRDSIVAKLSTDTMIEYMQKHDCSINNYLRMRGLGYKSRSKYRADFWSMPNRLRIYMVTYAYSKKEFMDWVTMKSMVENFVITREGIEKFISTIHDMRSELITRLEKRNSPTMSDFEKLSKYPFYRNTEVLEEMVAIGKYNQLLSSMRFRTIPDLSSYTPEDLRTLLWEILKDLEMLEEEMEKLPSNSFLKWYREDERPFNTISSIYLKWCRMNNCFKAHQVGRDPESVTVPVDAVNEYPEPWSKMEKHVHINPVSDFEDFWYWDLWTISYWFRFSLGALGSWLIIDWLSIFSTDPSSASTSTIVDGGLSEGPPPKASGFEGLWWAAIWGFLGMSFFILILGMIYPVDELSALIEFLNSMLSYQYEGGLADADMDLEVASSIQFPTLRELIEWNNNRYISNVVRSPEIGHGWSEPWIPNETWPEQWR